MTLCCSVVVPRQGVGEGGGDHLVVPVSADRHWRLGGGRVVSDPPVHRGPPRPRFSSRLLESEAGRRIELHLGQRGGQERFRYRSMA